MNATLAEKVQTGFPTSMKFPDILSQLSSWDEGENQDRTISGSFELYTYGRDSLSRWIDQEAARNRLGIFGLTPDGGMYCIWLQDNGNQPVVYIGNDQFAMLLAKDIEDFLRLLAIGYDEICGPDLSHPPEEESGINKNFQAWVSQKLNTTIPAVGQGIVDQAKIESDDIGEWLSANCTW
jgi:hypothetical protein